MILTPELIERASLSNLTLPIVDDCGGELYTVGDIAQTLAAYAAVVERVADTEVFDLDDTCVFCAEYLGAEHPRYMAGGHRPDCIYLEARRLRGKA